jgi:peptide/nickel transport system ATP-binding protein
MSVRKPVVEVENLTKHFDVTRGLLRKTVAKVRAVDGVSFDIAAGETLCLVGESGCGKSTVAKLILRLIEPSAGSVVLGGTDVTKLDQAGMREHRRHVQMVFQDPYASLNPRLRVTTTLAEPILFYDLARTRADAADDAAMLLAAVGLDADSAGRFPHAFSGGQRQRVSIARALAARPALLICDEPTSSLDVSVQAQVLNLLKDLRDGAGLAILFISHDLAVVRQMCDRVVVMKDGRVCETAETEALFEAPTHPYTRELMRLVPRLETIHARFPATAG